MGKVIIGTLNVNQLGVPMGATVVNASKVIYENLNLLIKYIDKFFSNNEIPKILILNEMKYERNSMHVLTMAFMNFQKIMKEKGYKIIQNDYTNTNYTIGFITLAITQEDIAIQSTLKYSKSRYIELVYNNLVILGLHQDLKTDKIPLVDFVKQQETSLVILGDFNINKYSDNSTQSQYESEYDKLISNYQFEDVFGNSSIPTYRYGTRIDYVLVSSNLTKNIIIHQQDNSTRLGADSFTDHSLLMIELIN